MVLLTQLRVSRTCSGRFHPLVKGQFLTGTALTLGTSGLCLPWQEGWEGKPRESWNDRWFHSVLPPGWGASPCGLVGFLSPYACPVNAGRGRRFQAFTKDRNGLFCVSSWHVSGLSFRNYMFQLRSWRAPFPPPDLEVPHSYHIPRRNASPLHEGLELPEISCKSMCVWAMAQVLTHVLS